MKLKGRDHKILLRWAADCAERSLALFEKERRHDKRPRKAIEVARRIWAAGETTMSEVRSVSLAAHAAARAAGPGAARLAARAAGHAIATAHVASHARGLAYAVAAVAAVGGSSSRERAWQKRRLPRHLRSFVFPSPAQLAKWKRGEESAHWPRSTKK